MAYPNPITTTGALTMTEVFGYFKGAMQALLNGSEQTEFTEDRWIDGFATDFGGGNYPITRNQFNTIISNNFTDSSDLLNASEPASGWPVAKVIDWGRIQTIKLAVFGSVSGSGSDQSLSSLTGSRKNTSGWTICSQTYLRFAFSRFDSYGACYPVTYPKLPAPTGPSVNPANRTFNWTYATGYTSPSDYEYMIESEDTEWMPVTTKPITIPTSYNVPIGGLLLRTKSNSLYVEPSDPITNGTALPGDIIVFVNLTQVEFSSYVVTAEIEDQILTNTNLTISGNVRLYRLDSSSFLQSYTVTIFAGNYLGSQLGLTPETINPIGPHFIDTGTPSPTSILSGRSVVVYLNTA